MSTLTSALLRHRAGHKSYWRGLAYRDAVVSLEVHPRHVTGVVVGTAEYEVSLAWDAEVLVGSCSCPYGAEGFFCKHCVAVGLVLLARGLTVPPPDAEDSALRARLAELPPEVLADFLYEQAARDPALRARVMRAPVGRR
ncbi:SWIM zinc finger family protein [Saccharothrix coeruleofusca]|uniref:SWIM-type domain-containing protein n=1 Tax=Saccharothrix coeruleofusca TaxID=33919 RepID=A0A918AJP2_9PSEU|nr:SWIM zinc finger family protein [Saccharothrix coeruleofusca]MBP2338655.1 putative Zn finger protein [Saccharothrix coeruleofusca]GGP46889.1 hypothetical protein GCM10010185_18310 [Saccharothrix coeruleofusca]